MHSGAEVTLPIPAPARMTDSAARWRTVSVVLAVVPDVSVTVIVVLPESSAVARPAESMPATAGLLLVHAIPVPLIVTGLVDGVVVPSPSCPPSFMPQQRTRPEARSAQL